MNIETAAALRDIFRIGEVVETDPEKCTARVTFPDTDDVISAPLAVAQRKTHKDKDFWMPDIGELVGCVFLGNGPIAGFIMFAIYNKTDTPPVADADKHYRQYEDGTSFEYDRKEHKLTVQIKGDAIIDIGGEDGGSLKITAKDGVIVNTENTVDITVAKDINVTTDKTAKITAANATIKATDEVTVECPAVKLGTGASSGVVHAQSSCPIYGVFHLNPSQTVTVAP
jgi:phage baseplate assembly protein V